MLKRKLTYRLYPNQQHCEMLLEMLHYHNRIYNMALEERIRVYREEGRSLSFYDQCKILTQWRAQNTGLNTINAQSLQQTLRRVDLAFQGFYRRVKSGETPGFPRFKSIDRFKGWGYKTHGDGWRILTDEQMKNGRVRLSGVGMIKMRGQARIAGTPKTAEIVHKQGKWYISITIECNPVRKGGRKAVGLDWGVETLLTKHNSDGVTESIDNPRYLKSVLSRLKVLQQAVSRKGNKTSRNRRKAIKQLSRQHARVANKRKDVCHQETAKLVREYGLIACEELNIKGMTKAGGHYKKGLNREILSTAPGKLHQLLKSKAEEAGIVYVEVPTRKIKPSQTCYKCKKQSKKLLSERWHNCACGANCSRDENAARVILDWALCWASGQELAEVWSCSGFAAMKHETHALP